LENPDFQDHHASSSLKFIMDLRTGDSGLIGLQELKNRCAEEIGGQAEIGLSRKCVGIVMGKCPLQIKS
jgi:hypothetical protein